MGTCVPSARKGKSFPSPAPCFLNCEPVSRRFPRLGAVRDLLLSGKVRDARFQSEELPKQSTRWFLPTIFCSRWNWQGLAVVVSVPWPGPDSAYRYHPDDLLTCLHYARSLLIRQMHGKGIALLDASKAPGGRPTASRNSHACMQTFSGDAGFETSCLEILKSLEHDPVANTDPLSLYHRSCAYEGLRRWPAICARKNSVLNSLRAG